MSATHPAARTEAPAPAPPRDWATTTALALCFLLGGLAALVYQTAWTRQFALVFGTSRRTDRPGDEGPHQRCSHARSTASICAVSTGFDR